MPWYPDHPPVVTLREDAVAGPIGDFFGRRIFGPNRRLFLAQAPVADPTRDHDARVAALRAQIADLQRRQDNLMRELESYTPTGDVDLDTAWRTSVQTRFAANAADQRAKTRQLDELAHTDWAPQQPDAALLDALPERDLDITELPAELQRALYDAFHLELRYRPEANELILRVTLSADTVPALSEAWRGLRTTARPPRRRRRPAMEARRAARATQARWGMFGSRLRK